MLYDARGHAPRDAAVDGAGVFSKHFTVELGIDAVPTRGDASSHVVEPEAHRSLTMGERVEPEAHRS